MRARGKLALVPDLDDDEDVPAPQPELAVDPEIDRWSDKVLALLHGGMRLREAWTAANAFPELGAEVLPYLGIEAPAPLEEEASVVFRVFGPQGELSPGPSRRPPPILDLEAPRSAPRAPRSRRPAPIEPPPAEVLDADPDGPETAELLAKVLVALDRLGAPTVGMVAFEIDEPLEKAASALGALEVEGKVRRLRIGRDLRWRKS